MQAQPSGSSSSGRATSGCRWRCGRSRSASTSSGSTSTPTGSKRWTPASPTSRTSPTSACRPPWPPGGTTRPSDVRRRGRLRHRRHHRADAAARRRARPAPTSRRPPATLRPVPAAGCTVILESTTYPGTTEELVGPILEDGSGLAAGQTSTSATAPSASTRATRPGPLENTPKVVSGVDDASLAAVQGFYDRLVEQTVPVASPQGGRAHQAAREHLPPRQHRAGQRAGDVRHRPRHRRVGGHRRRLDEAVRLHAVHAGPRRRRALPARSTRRTCRGGSSARSATTFRFVELANDVNEHMPDYVVRRLVVALNRRGLALKGQRILLLGPGLQGEHRRRAGVAGDPRRERLWRPAPRSGRRPARPAEQVPDGVGLVEPTAERSPPPLRGRGGRSRRVRLRPRRPEAVYVSTPATSSRTASTSRTSLIPA